ncbi:hypothetical protein F5148DRAFT_1280279 [Russula earlei]|uniref:Uncharacterized protein n=1 Tax=Russula earlei TaxID=71964 RepID=A0ACC0UJJ0_9AGAM|nr:hypothetical protein F5148DRAFT_1280279 [Russula earlei]
MRMCRGSSAVHRLCSPVQEERQLVLRAVRRSNFLIARPEYILCDDVGIVGIFNANTVVAFLAKNTDGILKDKVHDLQNKLVELRSSLYLCGPRVYSLRPGFVFCSTQFTTTSGDFVSHPARLFSMTFLFAALVIHKSVLRTSHADMNINETSSYVDLAPLYGNNKETLDNRDLIATDKIRVRDGRGLLFPDTFTEDPLLLFPPAV